MIIYIDKDNKYSYNKQKGDKMIVYTRDFCIYCDRAKRLLKEKNIEYQEIKIGIEDNDMKIEEFKSKFPDAKTFPHIINNDEVIGTYDNLTKWIDNNGY